MHLDSISKVCESCGAEKPIDAFRESCSRGYCYRRKNCLDCERINWRKPRSEQKIFRTFVDPVSGEKKKQCRGCKRELTLDGFPTRSDGGPKSYCWECTRTRGRDLYWKNPEKPRKAAREYHYAHRDERREAYNDWRERNREHVAEYQERYNNENHVRKAAYTQRRRAVIAGVSVIEEFNRAAIIERDGSTCYLCGKELKPRQVTLDHVVPLSRGGSHTADNLRVCCLSCNRKKWDKLLEELPA